MLSFALLGNNYLVPDHEDFFFYATFQKFCHFTFHTYDPFGGDFYVWYEALVRDFFSPKKGGGRGTV